MSDDDYDWDANEQGLWREEDDYKMYPDRWKKGSFFRLYKDGVFDKLIEKDEKVVKKPSGFFFYTLTDVDQHFICKGFKDNFGKSDRSFQHFEITGEGGDRTISWGPLYIANMQMYRNAETGRKFKPGDKRLTLGDLLKKGGDEKAHHLSFSYMSANQLGDERPTLVQISFVGTKEQCAVWHTKIEENPFDGFKAVLKNVAPNLAKEFNRTVHIYGLKNTNRLKWVKNRGCFVADVINLATLKLRFASSFNKKQALASKNY
ncbi:MAG: hypothetical protein ABIG20_01330 [archaeon]